MDDDRRGQITHSAAEVYEEFFVPGLLLPWAVRVADVARLAPGQRVLDVACGTGVLTIEVARRVLPGGAVAGLDRNEDMLAVAHRKDPRSSGGPAARSHCHSRTDRSMRWSASSA